MTPTEFRRIRRDVLHLRQQELAKVLGVCARTVRYYEAGAAIPRPVGRLMWREMIAAETNERTTT